MRAASFICPLCGAVQDLAPPEGETYEAPPTAYMQIPEIPDDEPTKVVEIDRRDEES